jgi:hypothetical protein
MAAAANIIITARNISSASARAFDGGDVEPVSAALACGDAAAMTFSMPIAGNWTEHG